MSLAMEWTYEDVSEELDKIAHCHIRRYGGEYEEIRANANTLFVQAYLRYKPEIGKFIGYLWYFVRLNLLPDLRKEIKRAGRFQPLQDQSYEERRFDLEDFLRGLSPAAAEAVSLVLQGESTNRGARTKVHTNKGGVRAKAHPNRGAVRRYLKDLGWSVKKITAVFHEIREAL